MSTAEARSRILAATATRLLSVGAFKLNMQDVADEAGVSKGLIHYHFDSKDTLLARAVEWLSVEINEREAHALEGATAQSAIDMLWRWIASELALGHVRILTELAYYPSPAVQASIQTASQIRRDAAARTVDSLFAALQLRPRVPSDLMGAVLMAFINGMVVEWAIVADAERRVAFDVFWLAMLSLAE
jgi:AcrR family transcriptional regulator